MSDEKRKAVAGLLASFAALYPNVSLGNSDQEEAARIEAWYEQLKDLPAWLIEEASRRVVREQEIPALPGLGKVRRAAERILEERAVGHLPGSSKAWALVGNPERWRRNYDGMVVGIEQNGLPGEVAEAARRYGPWNLEEDRTGFGYQRFERIYREVLAERSRAEIRKRLGSKERPALMEEKGPGAARGPGQPVFGGD